MSISQFYRRVLFYVVSAVLVCACATPPQREPAAAPAGNYGLDPTHTSVIWSVSHAGLSRYTARFDTVSGTLDFDPDTPENSRVFITIAAASISTGLPDFDRTIAMDARYFDAGRYPDIIFESTSATRLGDNVGTIDGNLTFRGVTRPVTLAVTFYGSGKSFGHAGKTLGFAATTTLKRHEFGLTHLAAFGIGDAVEVRIETEFNEDRPDEPGGL